MIFNYYNAGGSGSGGEAITITDTTDTHGGTIREITAVSLAGDTVTADKLLSGYTAHDASGTAITGTYVPSGGGSVTKRDVIFIDYDGTELYGFTKAEIQAMTSDSDLPANPSHNGLTAQGWNWTVAQLKAQLTAMPNAVPLYVGQMYVTTSGDTEIDVDIPKERKDPYLSIAVNGTATIDWGDNSSTDTITGTSKTSRIDTQHIYASSGRYTIKITVPSGSAGSLYTGASRSILNKASTTNSANNVYGNFIKAVRIGNRMDLGDYAFYYAAALKYVTLPSGVTLINSSAFCYCSSLIAFIIPSGVTELKTQVFGYCYGALKYVSIPSSATNIKGNVFYAAHSLRSVVLPHGITLFTGNLFSNCYSCVSLIIPSTVATINQQAFSNCYGMKEYHFLSTTPPTLDNTNAFSNIQSDCIIYVPRSENQTVLNAYKTASNWATYASYMQEEPQ